MNVFATQHGLVFEIVLQVAAELYWLMEVWNITLTSMYCVCTVISNDNMNDILSVNCSSSIYQHKSLNLLTFCYKFILSDSFHLPI
jgi:hypothetical protein